MVTRPQDLTVAKNTVAAGTIAAKLHDLMSDVQARDATDASAIRLVRGHVNELFDLAGIEGDELEELKTAGRNGVVANEAMLRDLHATDTRERTDP